MRVVHTEVEHKEADCKVGADKEEVQEDKGLPLEVASLVVEEVLLVVSSLAHVLMVVDPCVEVEVLVVASLKVVVSLDVPFQEEMVLLEAPFQEEVPSMGPFQRVVVL